MSEEENTNNSVQDPDEVKKPPNAKEQYKKLNPKAKRNVNIFFVLVILFFISVIWMFWGGSEETDSQTSTGTTLSKASQAGVESSERDITQGLEDVSSATYRNQIRQAEEENAQRAKNTGDESYVSDVTTLDWKGDEDARNPNDVDFELKPITSQPEQEEVTSAERATSNLMSQANVVVRGGSGTLTSYEQMARDQNRGANAPSPRSSRYQVMNGKEREAYLQRKQDAALQLIGALNKTSSSKINNHSDELQRQSQSLDQATQYSSPEPRETSVSRTSYVGGVVPGDRFVGATRMSINSDNTSWVDLEIGAGSLRGATVGLVPKLIHDEVVLVSESITFERQTASFNAIAVNPGRDLEPAFATEVDMRYLARIGSAVATEVLGTVAELIGKESESSVTQNGYVGQSVDFSKEELALAGGAAGLSEGARQLNQELSKLKPQVKVKAGHRVILVVTKAQEIPWLPSPYQIKKHGTSSVGQE